jgi:rubrerythrin
MSRTSENVEFAFAGESQANRRYLFFAEKADEEGNKQVARLFRATAEAETVHARNHLRVMGGINATNDNLSAAIGGEHHEFTQMYPGFIKQAESEQQQRAMASFDLANKVEQLHHAPFQTALGKLQEGQAMDEQPFFVCQICGNTLEGTAPEKCPVCGAPSRMFKQVD